VPVDPRSENGVSQACRCPSHDLAIPKPGSQGVCGRTQGNTAPRLAEVLEIDVDMIGSATVEGISVLVQIGEEGLDVPLLVLARRKGPSPFLALALEEIFEPRIIAAKRRSLIVFQAAKPFQKAAGDGTEVRLRPARSSGPARCYSSSCPSSRDGLELCNFEAMFSGPSLDLLRDG